MVKSRQPTGEPAATAAATRRARTGDNRSAAVLRFRTASGTILLWFGVLAGPIAWALRLQLSYVLVPHACAAGTHLSIHLVTLITAALALAGAVVAWRCYRTLGDERSDTSGAGGRSRFMALGGIVVSVWFAVQILVEGIPALIVGACA